MAEYIEKGTAIDALDKLCDVVCQYSKKQRYAMCGACPLGSAYDVIENAPSVDVVEVVRCKDCIYGHRCFNVHRGVTDSWVNCRNPKGINRDVSDDGYCSYGERKDGE